jgi:hypothetical protein
MERYRSGHNGAVLKTVCLHGRMGSNPILSAENHLSNLRWFFYARGSEIPDGRSNDTEDFLIRYIWYVKLTLTQCNDEENKVKKFFNFFLIFFRTTLQSRLFTGFAVTIFFCIFIIKSLYLYLYKTSPSRIHCHMLSKPSYICICTKLLPHIYTVIC